MTLPVDEKLGITNSPTGCNRLNQISISSTWYTPVHLSLAWEIKQIYTCMHIYVWSFKLDSNFFIIFHYLSKIFTYRFSFTVMMRHYFPPNLPANWQIWKWSVHMSSPSNFLPVTARSNESSLVHVRSLRTVFSIFDPHSLIYVFLSTY